MTGFRRMVESETTPVERWLLDSAVDDVPPADGARRLLLGLGVGASAASVAAAASMAHAAVGSGLANGSAVVGAAGVAEVAAAGAAVAGTAAAGATGGAAAGTLVAAKAFAVLGAKWLGAGVVAGALATGTLRTTVATDPTEPIASVGRVNSPSATESGERGTRGVTSGSSHELGSDSASIPTGEQGRGAAAGTARADAEGTGDLGVRSVPSGSPGADPASIAGEVAVVDQARSSLRSGDVHGAISALATHDREFGDGALSPEASRLRCETLMASGKRALAASCARSHLASYPASPHGSSMRSLLARVEGHAQGAASASFEVERPAPVQDAVHPSAAPAVAPSPAVAPQSVGERSPSVAAFPDG